MERKRKNMNMNENRGATGKIYLKIDGTKQILRRTKRKIIDVEARGDRSYP